MGEKTSFGVTFSNSVLRYRARVFPSSHLRGILTRQGMWLPRRQQKRTRPEQRAPWQALFRPGYFKTRLPKRVHRACAPVSLWPHRACVRDTEPVSATQSLCPRPEAIRLLDDFRKRKSSGAGELAVGRRRILRKCRGDAIPDSQYSFFYCFGFFGAGFFAGLSAALPPPMASRAALASGMPLAAALVNSSLAFVLSCFTPTPFR